MQRRRRLVNRSGLGVLQNNTGVEVMKRRELLNYLVRVSQTVGVVSAKRSAVIVRRLRVRCGVGLGADSPPPSGLRPSARALPIGVMERVLEGAVEHGAADLRERLQAIAPDAPAQLLILGSPRVRGFRLDGYGVFFDVLVPSFEGTMPWIIRTLDQNDLGLDSALKSLKSYVDAACDTNLEQALKRVELQVSPVSPSVPRVSGARNVTGPATTTSDSPPAAGQASSDPILVDPQSAYRTEVTHAVMDAMLDHSSSLGVGDSEWLTVAERRNDDRPRLAPADSEAGTVVIRVKGEDLSAFLARQISREEALKRIEVRVF